MSLLCVHDCSQEVPLLRGEKYDILTFLRRTDPIPSSKGMTLLAQWKEEMEHQQWKAGIKNMHTALAQCLDWKSRKHRLFLTEEQIKLRPEWLSIQKGALAGVRSLTRWTMSSICGVRSMKLRTHSTRAVAIKTTNNSNSVTTTKRKMFLH